MADAQLTVLIELQNRMSSELEKVKKDVGSLADDSQKNTEKIANGFTNVTERLLAVANVASAAEHIFSSYENLQLRLENASERVANAHQRVEDAQTKVNRLVEDGKTGSREYTDAIIEQERAQRNLIISQNNQERAQNMVIGTYIQMTAGALQVAGSLGTLVKWVKEAKTTEEGYNIVLAITEALISPLGIAIALASVALAAYTIESIQSSNSTQNLNESINGTKIALLDTVQPIKEHTGFLESLKDAYKELGHDIDVVVSKIRGIKPTTDDFVNLSPSPSPSSFSNADLLRGIPNADTTQEGQKYKYGTDKYGNPTRSIGAPPLQDFIMRPGQTSVSFSSDDTIIGMKNPKMGGTINITIDNVYGVNAKDISIALKKELSNKLSL